MGDRCLSFAITVNDMSPSITGECCIIVIMNILFISLLVLLRSFSHLHWHVTAASLLSSSIGFVDWSRILNIRTSFSFVSLYCRHFNFLFCVLIPNFVVHLSLSHGMRSLSHSFSSCNT